ncbi:MAG: ATP-binding cassette domain-containing protein, partial [Alphaproteobacteria bacterium]
MRSLRLNLPSILPSKRGGAPIPAAFADRDRAMACQACARHDAPALTIEGVSHAYGAEGLILDDVSLCLHPGEIVSLVGPSGCGKTTTLRLVAGLERAQTGLIQ